jgi:hypothetical protein
LCFWHGGNRHDFVSGVYLFRLEERSVHLRQARPDLFPYLIFIAAAIISVALNLEKHFSSAALGKFGCTLRCSPSVSPDSGFSMTLCADLCVWRGRTARRGIATAPAGHALTLSGWKPKFDLGDDRESKKVTALLGGLWRNISQNEHVISQFLALG